MARVLILDDDKLFGALMRRGLGYHAHEVTVTESALEARAALAADTFDAMVCDLILPDENGLHLLRELISIYPTMATIAISSGKVAAVDLLQLAQTVGVDAIVKKPLELTSFLAVVEKTLSAKQAALDRKHVV